VLETRWGVLESGAGVLENRRGVLESGAGVLETRRCELDARRGALEDEPLPQWENMGTAHQHMHSLSTRVCSSPTWSKRVLYFIHIVTYRLGLRRSLYQRNFRSSSQCSFWRLRNKAPHGCPTKMAC